MKKIVVCVLVSMLFLTGCDWLFVDSGDESGGGSGGSGIGHIREFNAVQMYSDSPSVPITVTAKLVEENAYVKIYLKEGQTMSSFDISYIADNFASLYPGLKAVYGSHADFDRNGKVIILLYDINDDVYSDNGYVAGFFRPLDLFMRDNKLNPYSNEGEVLYVESQVSNQIESIFTTVIHEFQHLINMSLQLGTEVLSDLWINEALSESTEIVMLDAMSKNRLNLYNSNGYGSHDVITKGNYFYTWDGSLADYSTVSLFMYWLYLNGNGTLTINHIAQGENRGTYQAVLDSIKNTAPSLSSLTTWENVMFSWLEANQKVSVGYLNGKSGFMSGEDVYHKDLSLTSKIYVGSENTISLYPGDAVITSQATLNGSNVERRDFDSGAYNITLNTDTTIDDPSTTSVTLQKTPSNVRRLRSVIPILEDTGEPRIIPYEQKPLDFDNLKAISE